MFEQLAPELLQSCHRYVYDDGLPLHDPLLVVTVWPCTVEPLTVGTAELDGGDGGAAVTTAVAAELADADPPAFVAVTTERTVSPTSPAVSV
jgi:hypothetical protein